MSLNASVKKNWVAIQRKHNYPVNAIGVKIAASDQATLKVWRQEGIHKFVRA